MSSDDQKQRIIASDVLSFIDKASDLHAQLTADDFSQDLFLDCLNKGMQTPIEDLFWIACRMHCLATPTGFNSGLHCVSVVPQARIGAYRVDFLLQQHLIAPDELYGPVVVELDGHDFHDKNKHQRAYEKARDRFLVSNRYRVLHFTGSEVVADPYKVAFEALLLLGVFCGMRSEEYDPKDPLDMAG